MRTINLYQIRNSNISSEKQKGKVRIVLGKKLTDNRVVDGNNDTAGGTRRYTGVAEGMDAAPAAVPDLESVVRFTSGEVSGADSPTTTSVTETIPLTTPQGDFAIQLQQITQGFSAGLGTPQSLEALLTLAGAPECGAGIQPTLRTG